MPRKRSNEELTDLAIRIGRLQGYIMVLVISGFLAFGQPFIRFYAGEEYSVRCQVFENHEPLIDLTLSVPTEKEAAAIALNWQKKNQVVYAWLMSQLL